MSSTILMGEPATAGVTESTDDGSKEVVDAEAEAEFSQVINGIKEARIRDDDSESARPKRPHHSAEKNDQAGASGSPQPAASSAASTITEGIATNEVPLRRCLFCNYNSPAFKLNVMHMTKYHSMFIPEQSYLVNLEGLVSWLYTRVHDLHECLYCHKIRATTEAVQTHMRDVGHCKIAFEEEEDMIEVGQFYDFTSTYSDPEEESDEAMDDIDDIDDEDKEKGGVKVVDPRKVLKTVVSDENGDLEMENGDENGEGWETDSSASSLDSADLTAVPIDRRHMYKQKRLQSHRHHSHDDPRRHRSVDGFHSHAHSHHAAFYSDNELHLPSGRTAGHRSLNRYYRQNLHHHPSPSERMEQQQRLLEERARDGEDDEPMTGEEQQPSSQRERERGRQVISRANGGAGMLGVTDAKKREVRAVEKKEMKRAQRAEKQYEWGVNKRANNQKHFRDPLLQ